MLPQPAHARQVVLELRELDLELAVGAACVLREDVEDQLCPVDDARLQGVLERPLLRWAELLVDEEHLRARPGVRVLQLTELALAHERARVGMRAMLDDLRHGRDTGGARELAQLGELLLAVDALREHSDDEPALRLRPGRRIGLAYGHDRIMPR